ncbi:protein insensitive-like [Leptidea sinapis]|uniref:protein insensitive-like n=1 Tax=Leptidea sinapis TaxID=189913 RepID=UPI0021C29F64|nr:protein insensitive-like [Leptidea sinapis]
MSLLSLTSMFSANQKKTCDKGTQTEFEYQLPEIEKMQSIIKDLCSKIETLESQLKTKASETLSMDSFEKDSDTSSDYSIRRRKRKRTSTKSSTFVESDFEDKSGVRKQFNSSDPDFKIHKEETPLKRLLKAKDMNKLTSNGEMVSLGDGNALVPARLIKYMDWSSYTNVTRKLLTAVFSRKVLATHSLTGKPSPAFPNKPPKKKLDPALVYDIVQTVVEKCSVPENVVRTSITTKCADESKMLRSRQKNLSKKKAVKKENISPSEDSADDSYSD